MRLPCLLSDSRPVADIREARGLRFTAAGTRNRRPSEPTADTCLAIFKQLFADAYLYSYDLEELARHYVRYHRLMDTWRERFPERFIDVDYESLVSDTEETLRPVLQYIGLSWNPACLDYFKGAARSSTASAVQVQEAPHSRSVGRWKRHERELRPALDILASAGLA